jgi:hypothetical protein
MPNMWRYAVTANYTQLKHNNHNKGVTMYIDGRPKASRIITGFIKYTRHGKARNQPNCVFEGHEGNKIFVCAAKTIVVGEEFLIDYDLNRIDGSTVIMGVNMFYQYTKPVNKVFIFIYLT